MRLALLLTLAATVWCADPADFKNEDLRAVRLVFKRADASLDWFKVRNKMAIDATGSLLLVEAAPTEPWRGTSKRVPVYEREQIGLFVVAGKANAVRLTLDTFALSSVPGRPELDQADGHAAYLQFHSDYGFYQGSIKYFYDLTGRRPPLKVRYGNLALTSVTRDGGKLRYQASFGQGGELASGWTPRFSTVTITPRAGSLPAYQIGDTAPQEPSIFAPESTVRVAGQPVVIVHATVPGQPDRTAGISLSGKFYPVPVPTLAQHRTLRPREQPPLEIHNDIGPFAISGARIWFANTFYDGEGYSGVGAIGSFDVATRTYRVRYLPEMAPWSGSALLLDGRDLWIGLKRQPEGAEFGGGLLRYNLDTGAVNKFTIPDLIYTLDRIGETLYCGTSNGLYTLRADQVTHLRFEPDRQGKLIMASDSSAK